MTTIDKIVFSQNAPAKNTLWARPSEKGTELLIFNKGKWGTVGADDLTHYEETSERTLYTGNIPPAWRENDGIFFDIPLDSLMQSGEEIEMKITPGGADGPTVLRGIAGDEDEGMVSLKTSYPSGPLAYLYNEYQQAFGKFNLVIYGIIVPQDTDFEIEIKVLSTTVLNEKFIPATIARTEELRSGVFYNSNISRLTNVNGGYINNIRLARIDFDAGSSNSIDHLYNLNMLTGNISGVHNLDMSSGVINMGSGGTISEVATLSFKSGGTLAPSIKGVQEIFGKNNVHISMSGSTTGDGIDFGNAPLKNINGIVMSTSSGIISGTLQGTIQSTTFKSGNTFTTGFIDELKTALGIS